MNRLKKLFQKKESQSSAEVNPVQHNEPTEKLFPDKIRTLHNEGRYRTALAYILDALDKEPNSKDLFLLATTILHVGLHRETIYTAVEPLTEEQVGDPRLDKMFCECSVCRGSWVINPMLTLVGTHFADSAFVFTANGVMCPTCKKTLCPKCARLMPSGDAQRCSQCNTLLQPITVPNGRTSKQLSRRAEPVKYAILFREGPIPPSNEFLSELFQSLSPDILQSNATVASFSMFPWPNGEFEFWRTIAKQFETWNIAPQTDSLEHYSIHDSHGTRFFIVKIYHPRRILRILEFASTSKYAQALHCIHCKNPNKANHWPEHGDKFPFRCQTKEQTVENPGIYRVTVDCQHCGSNWYVVWDQDPC